jgi:hypothetical protein
MEPLSQAKSASNLDRRLATLKLVSRLISHELHAQSTSKTISLSRDEVTEIQTCVDLFIEEATRRPGIAPALSASERDLAAPREIPAVRATN